MSNLKLRYSYIATAVIAALLLSVVGGVVYSQTIPTADTNAGQAGALPELATAPYALAAQNVVVYAHYLDDGVEKEHVKSILAGSGATVTEVDAIEPATLAAALAGADCFVVPELLDGSFHDPPDPILDEILATFGGFAPIVEDFMNAGGNVVVAEGDASGYPGQVVVNGLGFTTINWELEANSIDPLDIVKPDDPLVAGISSITGVSGYGTYSNPSGDLIQVITGPDGNIVASRMMVGPRNFTVLAFDYNDYTDDHARLLINACDLPTWTVAYEALFDSQSDLELMRQYRDEVLSGTALGRTYTEALYKASDEALAVLLANPALMARARALFDKHGDAVSAVLAGKQGVIANPAEVTSFLDAYAEKAPPTLAFLAQMLKREMLSKQKQKEPFLGFILQ